MEAAVKTLNRAYMTKADYKGIIDRYGEKALRKEEARTKEYINAVIAGPEPDLIFEAARIKRLWHEVNSPEEISDEEWHRMQLRMCKKGFDEGIKIYQILKAAYDLTKHKEIAHQIRKTAFDFYLLQDGVRPHDMSDEAAAKWEAAHGKLSYKWDGAHIVSNSGKAKFTPEEFGKYKNDYKVMRAMMAAAQPINQVEEGDDEYER